MPLQDSSPTDRALTEPPAAGQLTAPAAAWDDPQGRRAEAPVHRPHGGDRTGLRLVGHPRQPRREVGPAERRAAPIVASPAGVESFCPMHPSVVGEQSGQCPICGMPLAQAKRAGIEILPPGVLSRVRLAPGQIAQAGIRTVAVSFAPAIERLTTVGLVGFDDSRRVQVASEGRGRARIERLHVLSEGEHVRAGQRLAELYSYDVAQSIRVLLEASGAARSTCDQGRSRPDAARRSRRAVPARNPGAPGAGSPPGSDRRDRLGRPLRRTPAPARAHRRTRHQESCLSGPVRPGRDAPVRDRRPGPCLGRCPGLRGPTGARPRRPAGRRRRSRRFPARSSGATSSDSLPRSTRRRTPLAVRFGLDNPGDRLRPGMLATVALNVARRVTTLARGATCPVTRLTLGTMGPAIPVEVQGARSRSAARPASRSSRPLPGSTLTLALATPATPDRVMSVPESAVVDTGTKTIVYVEASPGVFEGRAVILGPRSGDSFPVLDGLAPGDRIAAAGAFLIDAETRLNPSSRSAGRTAAADDPR